MSDISPALEIGTIPIPRPIVPADIANPKPRTFEKILHRHEVSAKEAIDKVSLESLRNGFERTTEYPNGEIEKMRQVIMNLPDGTKVSVVVEEKVNFGKDSGKITTVRELGPGLPRILKMYEPTDTVAAKNLEKNLEYLDLSKSPDKPLKLEDGKDFFKMLRVGKADIPATNDSMQKNLEQNGGRNFNVRNGIRVSISLAREANAA